MIHCNRRLNGVCPELTGLEGVTNRFPSAILVIVFIRLSDVLSTGICLCFRFSSQLHFISFSDQGELSLRGYARAQLITHTYFHDPHPTFDQRSGAWLKLRWGGVDGRRQVPCSSKKPDRESSKLELREVAIRRPERFHTHFRRNLGVSASIFVKK